jgi:ATP-dependent Lon protease
VATAPGAVFFPYRQFSSNNLNNSIIIAIFARINEILNMGILNDIRKQAGWRVTPITILKVREAARRKNISANVFVEQVLTKETKDIETEEETDDLDTKALKAILKYKIQRIEELESQVEHLQSALNEEKVKSHEKLDSERERFNRSIDFLKEQVAYKDKRMDMLLEWVNEKDKILNDILGERAKK